jgi:uncharacterized metal-binding protein YceD (DUF177 family)
VDAFAMPFVQGQLRQQQLAVTFTSECAHCARPMRIEVDSELNYAVDEASDALVFLPMVNFAKLKAPNIIDDF